MRKKEKAGRKAEEKRALKGVLQTEMHPEGMHYKLCGTAALGRSLNALYRKKCAPYLGLMEISSAYLCANLCGKVVDASGEGRYC